MVALDDVEVQADEAQDEFAGITPTIALFLYLAHVPVSSVLICHCWCRTFSACPATQCPAYYML